MRLGLILVLAFLMNPATPAVMQTGAQVQTSHQQIVVRIRNGKTGRPIWFASPSVFLGIPDPNNSYVRTRFWADARVDVTRVEPREVRVSVGFIDRDCRYPANDNSTRTLSSMPFYSIDEILSTGIVAPNLCGTKTERPTPGVLTIYVIPATLKELWNE